VWEIATPDGPWVVKRAAPERVRLEAATLARLAGSGVAPRLVAAGETTLITERVAGGPRGPAGWSAGDAAALGALLARVHRVPAPDGHAAGAVDHGAQLAGIRADCRTGPQMTLEAAVAALPAPTAEPPVLLHGDPWSGNVVWSPAGPVLVDWEFARAGEPAEDLAYLAAVDELPDAALAAVLGGYGADPVLSARVAAWRPLMAVWCGVWLADRGADDRGARLVAHAERLLMPTQAN
jgi:aminoglycoside phosphotransferase (APT) family kinase protein